MLDGGRRPSGRGGGLGRLVGGFLVVPVSDLGPWRNEEEGRGLGKMQRGEEVVGNDEKRKIENGKVGSNELHVDQLNLHQVQLP